MVGYKQALGHSKPSKEDGGASSALFDHLLHLWGHGEISASACQKLAHRAHIDGLYQPSLVKMASAGAWGEYPSNISRDLKQQLSIESKSISLPMPSTIKNCPCFNPRLSQAEATDFSYFDPADLVAALHASPQHFHKFFVTDGLVEFWSKVHPHDPKLQALEREAGITRDVLHHCIPLWLHGNGVEYVDGRSLQFFFLAQYSILGHHWILPCSFVLIQKMFAPKRPGNMCGHMFCQASCSFKLGAELVKP